MPGCYEVKAILQWNWLKIEIWDLQTQCSNGMYSVSLDPLGPYPKFGSNNTCIGIVGNILKQIISLSTHQTAMTFWFQ